ncbi:4Fe-4S dicluster domain-containing protein [Acetobacter oeni]|uniref:4Fe-4S dicluster domain-containing protein n=1 Tax=Acetobacter oeni TaxID=304077 RepID=UPI0011BE5E52|nr:ferredoxin family protein [Acetobacter oeni]MBB3883699.1 NAD-dependent dihydropyrimidine dehydrogenase PreA subunit [Acetobacter oeni]NHO19720.1 4Fe-4S dicluster domain-containing protein [Acetobacter oeni]
MISVVFDERCTACNECVAVCPGDVFDARAGQSPVIARPDDCHTCFMCELYCRTDALYVAPQTDERSVSHDQAAELSGDFRRESGWDEWGDDPRLRNQHWRLEDVFRRARGV